MRDEFKITYRGIEAPEQIVAAISIEDVIEAGIWAEGVDSALDHKTIGETPAQAEDSSETVPPEYDYFLASNVLYRVKPGEQEAEFYGKARGVWYPGIMTRAGLEPYKLTAF